MSTVTVSNVSRFTNFFKGGYIAFGMDNQGIFSLATGEHTWAEHDESATICAVEGQSVGMATAENLRPVTSALILGWGSAPDRVWIETFWGDIRPLLIKYLGGRFSSTEKDEGQALIARFPLESLKALVYLPSWEEFLFALPSRKLARLNAAKSLCQALYGAQWGKVWDARIPWALESGVAKCAIFLASELGRSLWNSCLDARSVAFVRRTYNAAQKDDCETLSGPRFESALKVADILRGL